MVCDGYEHDSIDSAYDCIDKGYATTSMTLNLGDMIKMMRIAIFVE
jgi:hypothetical protein